MICIHHVYHCPSLQFCSLIKQNIWYNAYCKKGPWRPTTRLIWDFSRTKHKFHHWNLMEKNSLPSQIVLYRKLIVRGTFFHWLTTEQFLIKVPSKLRPHSTLNFRKWLLHYIAPGEIFSNISWPCYETCMSPTMLYWKIYSTSVGTIDMRFH